MKTSQGAILLVLGLLAVHLSTAIRCGEDEYRCRAGMCIPQYWVCDGDGDCFDNDDEMGCRYRTCESGGFQCSDGACIPSRWQCDGDPDCEDGSDEYQCRVKIQQAA